MISHIDLFNYRSIPSARLKLGSITVLVGPSNAGKCLGKGTGVITYSGDVVPVEKIKVGDKILSPFGGFETVISTHQGVSDLYRVSVNKGGSWLCNNKHEITLQRRSGDPLLEISVEDYLKKSSYWKNLHKMVTVPVEEYESRGSCPVSPYFLGLWFGDGGKTLVKLASGAEVLDRVSVTKDLPEVVAAIEEQAQKWGGRAVKGDYEYSKCPTYHIRATNLLGKMRELVGRELCVPLCVERGNRETRLEFLAGFLDTDGSLNHDKSGFEITQKREDWAQSIWRIARSLGFSATIREKPVSCQGGFEGVAWRVLINGDTHLIPTRVPHKKAVARSPNRPAKRFGFKVEEAGPGEYFGFTLDGEGRFYLEDYVVTHNSNLCRALHDFAHNPSSKDMVQHGKKVCRVGVGFGLHAYIGWERADKKTDYGSTARYVIAKEGEESVSLTKIGRSVPKEVTDETQVRPFVVDDLSFSVQFARQEDSWFLLSSAWTPKKVGKVVGAISGIEPTLVGATASKKEATRLKTKSNKLEKELEATESKLREFSWLDHAEDMIRVAGLVSGELNELEDRLGQAESLRKQFRELKSEYVEVSEDFLAVDSALGQLEALGIEGTRDRWSSASAILEEIQEAEDGLASVEEDLVGVSVAISEEQEAIRQAIEAEEVCSVCHGPAHEDCKSKRKEALDA